MLKDGQLYSRSSLLSLRNAIERYLNNLQQGNHQKFVSPRCYANRCSWRPRQNSSNRRVTILPQVQASPWPPACCWTWDFGMVDCSTSPATGFVQIVERRNAATLLPIIHQHIRPGTMVYSDEWRAYNQVGNLSGLEHRTVNHSLFFVDPVTGVHTQTIESY